MSGLGFRPSRVSRSGSRCRPSKVSRSGSGRCQVLGRSQGFGFESNIGGWISFLKLDLESDVGVGSWVLVSIRGWGCVSSQVQV